MIAQAYELMTGQKLETEKRAEPPVPVHRLNINDSQPVKKVSAMENKFVDDLTLETDLIDNNPKTRKKVYREPFSENNMYTTFIVKIKIVLGTLQVKLPKQYIFVFPIFWKIVIIIPTTDSIKYTNEGVHSSLIFLGNAIIVYIKKKYIAKIITN